MRGDESQSRREGIRVNSPVIIRGEKNKLVYQFRSLGKLRSPLSKNTNHKNRFSDPTLHTPWRRGHVLFVYSCIPVLTC